MAKWVSVDERCPRKNTEHFCLAKDRRTGSVVKYIATYHETTVGEMEWTATYDDYIVKVTYWLDELEMPE